MQAGSTEGGKLVDVSPPATRRLTSRENRNRGEQLEEKRREQTDCTERKRERLRGAVRCCGVVRASGETEGKQLFPENNNGDDYDEEEIFTCASAKEGIFPSQSVREACASWASRNTRGRGLC